jgi:WD40 repeat protein
MADIFISYNSADRSKADTLAQIFRRQGWSVWWDRDLRPGSKFHDRIAANLRAARCVVVLWSRHSVTSDWVRDEATVGAQRHILVPVLIDEVEIPLGFRQIHAARLVGWTAESDRGELDPLCEAIAAILNTPYVRSPGPPQSRRLAMAGAALAVVFAAIGVALKLYTNASHPFADRVESSKAPSAQQEASRPESGSDAPKAAEPHAAVREPAGSSVPPDSVAPPRKAANPPSGISQGSTRGLFQLRLRIPSGQANDLAFSADGTLLAAAGEAREEWYGGDEYDGLVHVWDGRSGAVRQRKVIPRKMQYRSAAFSQDGRSLFVAGESHASGAENPTVTVNALDVQTGKPDAALFTIDRAHVWRCRVRPDGRIVVTGEARPDSSTGSYDNWVKFIDPRTRTVTDAIAVDGMIYDWTTVDTRARFVVGFFRPDGRTKGGFGIRDLNDGSHKALPSAEQTDEPYAISEDGRYLAVTRSGDLGRAFLIVIDVTDENVVSSIRLPVAYRGSYPDHSLTFSADAGQIASVAWNAVHVWNTKSGELIDALPFNAETQALKIAAFSRDGRLIAAGGETSHVLIWERQAAPR